MKLVVEVIYEDNYSHFETTKMVLTKKDIERLVQMKLEDDFLYCPKLKEIQIKSMELDND